MQYEIHHRQGLTPGHRDEQRRDDILKKILRPTLIIEILSPSTAYYDFGNRVSGVTVSKRYAKGP